MLLHLSVAHSWQWRGLPEGLYSLKGRAAADPLAETGANFLRCVPMVVAVSLMGASAVHVTPTGVLGCSISVCALCAQLTELTSQ